ncbi:phosphotransferase family protein [Nocardia aurea]|uniref:Aminoglycoside phosphotransferase family protein n=1 Tax=Nocardia aurea TaxID=2144174 RepID=A0ABV3G264_9NOCA
MTRRLGHRAVRAVLDGHRTLLARLLRGDEVTEVREGQFHTVVMGSEIVVCLARTPAAARRLPDRAARLAALTGVDIGVAVPKPLALNVSGDPAYLVTTRVPGAPLDPATLEAPAVAAAVVRGCHAVLTALYSVAAERSVLDCDVDTVRSDLPAGFEFGRRSSGPTVTSGGADSQWPAAIPPAHPDRWARFADGIRTRLYPLMSAEGRLRAEAELAALDSLPYRTNALVHGDLGGENLLWERRSTGPRLVGVVDWDSACLADRAEDYAALGATFGHRFLNRLVELSDPAVTDGAQTPTTPSSRPDLVRRITAIRATFALQQALAGHHDNDSAELADGLAGYR